ncbi:MAG: tRNA adenosine(34) deaminase TadA [Gammaproteobacteria bacterium]
MGVARTGAERDAFFMRHAMALARDAQAAGEVPVGAVLVLGDDVIGQGHNRPIGTCDPSAHAEVMALRDAGLRQQQYRFPESELYVTLEPCAMCAGALIHARVARVVYGAEDPKSGAAGGVMDVFGCDALNHRVELHSGVLAQDCAEQLRAFFRARRKKTG